MSIRRRPSKKNDASAADDAVARFISEADSGGGGSSQSGDLQGSDDEEIQISVWLPEELVKLLDQQVKALKKTRGGIFRISRKSWIATALYERLSAELDLSEDGTSNDELGGLCEIGEKNKQISLRLPSKLVEQVDERVVQFSRAMQQRMPGLSAINRSSWIALVLHERLQAERQTHQTS